MSAGMYTRRPTTQTRQTNTSAALLAHPAGTRTFKQTKSGDAEGQIGGRPTTARADPALVPKCWVDADGSDGGRAASCGAAWRGVVDPTVASVRRRTLWAAVMPPGGGW